MLRTIQASALNIYNILIIIASPFIDIKLTKNNNILLYKIRLGIFVGCFLPAVGERRPPTPPVLEGGQPGRGTAAVTVGGYTGYLLTRLLDN